MKTMKNSKFFDGNGMNSDVRKYGVPSSEIYGQCWSMQYQMDKEISTFIFDVIKPKDENITWWGDLIEWNNGKYDKRMDNEDSKNMTDEQFEILRRMALVHDTLQEIYPQ